MAFLKSLVRTAGHGIKGAAKIAVSPVTITKDVTSGKNVGKVLMGQTKNVGEVAHAYLTVVTAPGKATAQVVGKVPIVGKPFKSLVNIAQAPFALTDSIIQGERIDRAVLNNLKQQVEDVKEVGPYAQMVVSLVPGVGTGISAGLGAGLALADGQPITAAIKAGVEGALPGGPAVKMAFNVAVAVAEKKPLDKIAIAALPIPDSQKKAIEIALTTTKDLAAGKRIDKIAFARVQEQIPKELKPAVNIGIAIGHGQSLQKAAIANLKPMVLEKLQADGTAILKVNPTMNAGYATLKDAHAKAGFAVGTAFTRFQVTPLEAVAVRAKLTGPQRKGFDMAVAGHIGAVEQGPPKATKGNPAAAFAFNATVGAQTLTSANQLTLINTLAGQAATREGVTLAATLSGSKPQARKTFWRRVFEALGLVKAA
jgi:hypothetical protein